MDTIDLATPSAPRLYRVKARDRQPLIDFMVRALEGRGCRILAVSRADRAPFRLAFETPDGERLGIWAYAFLANSRPTRNRPADEHRFQVKYGSKRPRSAAGKVGDGVEMHELWQDPWAAETTLLVGINTETGFWVAADPMVHNPTRFFISIEFKQRHVDRILEHGWAIWERDRRQGIRDSEPVELLIGGRPETFLDLVCLERLAKGMDPGHRQLVAEKLAAGKPSASGAEPSESGDSAIPHPLVHELDLEPDEVLDLIESAPRLKMAVRGWVAEEHLHRMVSKLDDIEVCERLEGEGKADLSVVYRGHRFSIECKNVLRNRLANGGVRVDFQRTRAAKSDPCSRFYSPEDFDIVAACLHSCTELWDFRFVLSRALDRHPKCEGKCSHLVMIDERWSPDLIEVLGVALELRTGGEGAEPPRPPRAQLELFGSKG